MGGIAALVALGGRELLGKFFEVGRSKRLHCEQCEERGPHPSSPRRSPVLSPCRCAFTPARWSMETRRLHIGVSLA